MMESHMSLDFCIVSGAVLRYPAVSRSKSTMLSVKTVDDEKSRSSSQVIWYPRLFKRASHAALQEEYGGLDNGSAMPFFPYVQEL